jgi:DNA-binding Lrp family transcriptional regulator
MAALARESVFAHMARNPTDRKCGYADQGRHNDDQALHIDNRCRHATMDDTDRAMIALLAADARMPLTTLARRLKLARSTVQARLERLETNGTIAGYTLRLGETARPGIRATILLTVEPRAHGALLARLRGVPEVERCVTTSGRFDLALTVAADSPWRLDELLDKIGELPGIRASESLIHLSTRIDRSP